MRVFSNSAATPPACKSRSPIRTASPSLTQARDCEIWAETYAPSATNRNKSASLFTHFHWDHIQGFPFFAQAYDPGQKITLLTLGRDQTVSNLREIFEVQMQAEYFPVQLDHMGADFEFLQIADASKHFTGIKNVETVVSAQRHNHPGGAYSFRIERNGKVLVVCTDVEHGEQIDPRLVELAQGADLLVHDAQYTAEELQKRRGWGHSSFDQAMQVAEMAGVKRLALTHHDPEHDDEFLQRIEKLCQRTVPQRGACSRRNGNLTLRGN